MTVVALFANLLIGYGARSAKGEAFLIPVLPMLLSIAFFLIADIDGPRGGVIFFHRHNLESLSESLQAH
ncbi:conserved hypothetical protein [Burkholderiales bacterium]|nr:conserved hypothetical protein [Burkholderiales bacterium]